MAKLFLNSSKHARPISGLCPGTLIVGDGEPRHCLHGDIVTSKFKYTCNADAGNRIENDEGKIVTLGVSIHNSEFIYSVTSLGQKIENAYEIKK